MKKLLITIIIILTIIVVNKLAEPRERAYNRHVCAVYGYFEDCKTKLPDELKIK